MNAETPVREPSLWQVVQAGTNVTRIPRGNREVLRYCEWLRLLVGRSLALAQRRSGSPHFEYLVFGVPLAQVPREDEDAPARIRAAVDADFAVLEEALRFHEQQVIAPSVSSPERFLRSYELLEHLRLPTNPEDWRVTDEGLTIVNWGLAEGKELFRWRTDDLRKIQSAVLQRIDSNLRSSSSAMAQRPGSGDARGGEQLAATQRELKDPKRPREWSDALRDETKSSKTVGTTPGRVQPRLGRDELFEEQDESVLDKLRSPRLWLNIAAIAVCALALLAIGFASARWLDRRSSQPESDKQVTPAAPNASDGSSAKGGRVSAGRDTSGTKEKGPKETEGSNQ
jgi:hypothetical protein